MATATVLVFLAGAGAALLAQEHSLAPSQIVVQCEEALHQHDHNKALSLVQDGLKRFPDDEDLKIELARVYVHEKRDPEAIAALNAVLHRNSSSRNAKLELAQIYGYRKDYKASDRLYRELLTSNADDEAASLGLIHNLVFEGKREEARQQIQQAQQRHPASLGLQRYSDDLASASSRGESHAEKIHRLQAGESFFADNSGNRSFYSSQGMLYQLSRNFFSRLRLEETSLWKSGTQKQNVLSGTAEGRLRLNKFMSLRSGGGAVRFDDSRSRSLYSGDLDLYPWKNLLLSGGYSRFPILPSLDSVQFDLLAEGWNSRLDYRTRNSSLTGALYLNHYSDGNHAEREYAEALRWIGGNAFAIGTGYAFRHLHFSQQLNHGYFSPSQYRSHLGAAGFRFRIGKIYRGEYLGYGGVELEGIGNWNPAGEVILQNEFFFGKWELDANYSRFQLIQSTGAFQANAGSVKLGYRF